MQIDLCCVFSLDESTLSKNVFSRLQWRYEVDVIFSLPVRGKFAVVRKCVEKSSGKAFAAKYMRKRRKGQDCRTEILHEIGVLELAAACPRVVNLHQVYETAGEMVLVLE